MPLTRSWFARGFFSLLGGWALAGSVAACDTGSTNQVTEEPPPSTVLPSLFGSPTQSGNGSSSDRWTKSDVARNDLHYFFMANGWGPGFESQSVSWNGTSFSVDDMLGKRGPQYEPVSYPTVFCGAYSDSRSGACGLPKALSEIQSQRVAATRATTATLAPAPLRPARSAPRRRRPASRPGLARAARAA